MSRRDVKPPRVLNDGVMRVSQDLVGRPLASPRRRAVAIAIDWVLLILPVLAVAIGAAALSLRVEAPGIPCAVREAVARGERDQAADLMASHDLQFDLALGEREEKPLAPNTVNLHVERLIPRPLRGIAAFGVATLYFTLCHASRRGQTLGKRLAGIRVAQLRGEKLRLFESFERCAGYLEIPASLGLSLIALWRDPNRQLPHDVSARMVVLRD